MFLEIHAVQNVAPTCLNRDQSNLPKETFFGGTRRARVSSQSWKRAIRENEEFVRIVGKDHVGDRTKNIVRVLVERLKENAPIKDSSPEDLSDIVTECVGWYIAPKDGTKKSIDGKSGDKRKTTVQLFYSQQEILWLQEQIAARLDKLLPALEERRQQEADEKAKQAIAQAQIQPDGKKGKNPTKSRQELKEDDKATKASALAKLAQEVEDAVSKLATRKRKGTRKSVVDAADIALFGRMVASNDDLDVEAACQYGQAISTHTVQMETDFFAAVDDLPFEGDQGADMLGQQDFNSSCFYRYARVDLEQLLENLDGDTELARKTLEGFAVAFLDSVPTGKKHSFDNNAEPAFALAVIRKRGRGWSLVNAFERPVPNLSHQGLLHPSITRLDEQWKKVSGAFDNPKESTVQAIHLLNLEIECATPNLTKAEANALENIYEWAERIARAMIPTVNEQATSD